MTFPPEEPAVNVAVCPAVVDVGLIVPPLAGVMVQLTGMLAENCAVAPLAKAVGLEGVIVTGGNRFTTSVAVEPPEPVAVIVTDNRLFGIGLADVNVTL